MVMWKIIQILKEIGTNPFMWQQLLKVVILHQTLRPWKHDILILARQNMYVVAETFLIRMKI